jgi:hypothetical protein
MTWLLLYGAAAAFALIIMTALCRMASNRQGAVQGTADHGICDQPQDAVIGMPVPATRLLARIDHSLACASGPYAMIGVLELRELRNALFAQLVHSKPIPVPGQITAAQESNRIVAASNAETREAS